MSALALSVAIVLISFYWQGNKGFNLWDEGFLWYGVQRVLLGDVPIRDFMAYDPGRYYWVATLVSLFGDSGIMSVRAAVAAFQALGLFAGVLLIAQTSNHRERSSPLFLIVAALILAVWMFPRHKLFDLSISIFLVGVLTYLVTNPTPKRYFLTGACVGLIAVFGRNHGVYGVAASVGVIAWLSINGSSFSDFARKVALWGSGLAFGFSPVILMALLIPGFGAAFLDSIQFLFDHKATNLPLPIPWPWTVKVASAAPGLLIRDVLVGMFFLGLLVFGALSLGWAIHRRIKRKTIPPALVASAFLALPYAHYAFSRADVGHLAHGIFPMLLGCLAVLSTLSARYKWPLAILLCISSFWTMAAFHPGWNCAVTYQCTPVEVSGSRLEVDAGTANDIAFLRTLDEQYAPNGRQFVVAPFWPGAYALLERESPVWEIFALFPRSASFEEKEIERIEAASPGFIFIFDLALDGRDALRFRNTHPMTYQYVLDNFDPVFHAESPAYQIFKSRGNGR